MQTATKKQCYIYLFIVGCEANDLLELHVLQPLPVEQIVWETAKDMTEKFL